jgi:rhodanese-related sulfurtransferase
MLPAVVDAAQVAELLERRPDLVLLDVLPDAYYVRRHIRGARNACVYKMAFLDDVAKLVPGRETPLIVYGDRPDSRASAVARDKLLAAGYRQVADFSTGLSAWRAAGGPTEGSGGEPEQDQPSPDGRHRLDPDKSSLRWFGRNLGSTHHGTLPLVEGDCTVERGRLRGACVVFDMTGIRCEDLTDRSTAEILEAHLRSDDFFDVERYPQATFSVTRAETHSRGGPRHSGHAVPWRACAQR